jgi:Domain of unknown function (DUF4188)
MIKNGRHTAGIDGEFVVFLIGARLNRLRSANRMRRVGAQMSKMQRTLAQHPELGCLHTQNWFGRTSIAVQYWRDFESVERFARDSDLPHLQPWREFNRLIREGGDIGVWHETFLVPAGSHESVYVNMPLFGLAAAGRLESVNAASTAARRLGRQPAGAAASSSSSGTLLHR